MYSYNFLITIKLTHVELYIKFSNILTRPKNVINIYNKKK
jgi:hypothetical protein